MITPDAYPLAWPIAVPRTKHPGVSAFAERSLEKARVELFNELRRLGADKIILSTNIELRLDGFPYSNRRAPQDKGVAVYFKLKGVDYCMPCDRWDRIECNVYAIAKHVEAMRGQNRWGVGNIEQAFRGYLALPAPTKSRPWRDVFGFDNSRCSMDIITMHYKKMAWLRHPDNGGSTEAMAELSQAYQQAKEELSNG